MAKKVSSKADLTKPAPARPPKPSSLLDSHYFKVMLDRLEQKQNLNSYAK
jgi:hypothetical protein